MNKVLPYLICPRLGSRPSPKAKVFIPAYADVGHTAPVGHGGIVSNVVGSDEDIFKCRGQRNFGDGHTQLFTIKRGIVSNFLTLGRVKLIQ